MWRANPLLGGVARSDGVGSTSATHQLSPIDRQNIRLLLSIEQKHQHPTLTSQDRRSSSRPKVIRDSKIDRIALLICCLPTHSRLQPDEIANYLTYTDRHPRQPFKVDFVDGIIKGMIMGIAKCCSICHHESLIFLLPK
jgi:hypothetical protein